MESCFKLKNNCDLKKRIDFYHKNKVKVYEILQKKVEEIFNLKIDQIKFNENWELYLNHKFVEKNNIEKKFSTIGNLSIYEKGKYIGNWALLKKNTKEYKSLEKFKKEYKELDINSVYIPRINYVYSLYGKIRTHYLNNEFYVILESKDILDENFIKDTEKIKMSEYWKIIENLEERG